MEDGKMAMSLGKESGLAWMTMRGRQENYCGLRNERELSEDGNAN